MPNVNTAPEWRAAPAKRNVKPWIFAAVGVLLIVAITGGLLFARSRAMPGLAGGVLTDAPAAPDFSLQDQNGATVSMSSLRGKVVALTFLYTHCPDVCPTMASQLAVADRKLGGDASKVELLAVSVDPVGDTLPSVKKFTNDHDLGSAPNWHYLIGAPSQLQPVWRAYHVGSSATGGTPDPAGIDHSALVYVIDPSGRIRAVLPANFTAEDFLRDVKALQTR